MPPISVSPSLTLILLGKISDRLPINVTALKRQIAERVSQEDKYVI
jgi:hypothetical protein